MSVKKDYWKCIDSKDNLLDIKWHCTCDGFMHHWDPIYTYDLSVVTEIANKWGKRSCCVRTKFDREEGRRIWIVSFKYPEMCTCSNNDHLFPVEEGHDAPVKSENE